MNPITPTQQALGLTEALRQRFLDHPALGLEVWEKFAANVEAQSVAPDGALVLESASLACIISSSFVWDAAPEGIDFWSRMSKRAESRPHGVPTDKLEALAKQWDKDAKGYLANAPVPEGTPPNQVTQYQQNSINIAGQLQLCAGDLRKLIKKS